MLNIPRDILQDWEVLVVEDDPINMDVACRILKNYGAKVSTATNGQEALERLQTYRPRFILCDLSMPIMDGWQLIEMLKQERDLATIPIFALTAHAMIGDREKALNAGFHNYMTKPFTAKTFMQNLMILIEEFPNYHDQYAS